VAAENPQPRTRRPRILPGKARDFPPPWFDVLAAAGRLLNPVQHHEIHATPNCLGVGSMRCRPIGKKILPLGLTALVTAQGRLL